MILGPNRRSTLGSGDQASQQNRQNVPPLKFSSLPGGTRLALLLIAIDRWYPPRFRLCNIGPDLSLLAVTGLAETRRRAILSSTRTTQSFLRAAIQHGLPHIMDAMPHRVKDYEYGAGPVWLGRLETQLGNDGPGLGSIGESRDRGKVNNGFNILTAVP